MTSEIGNRPRVKIVEWSKRHFGDMGFVYVAAVTIGVLSGIGAGLLKKGVGLVTDLIFSGFDMQGGNPLILMLPICGILIAVLWTKYVTHQPMAHASEYITADLKANRGNLSPRLIFGPIITCSLTLGLGGSAGAEDPCAYTGAAIGSNVGKAFKMPKEMLSNLMGCGAAAAIAGIFMAPVGGVMFALEVLRMRQTLNTVLAIVLSSLIAALTCYIMLGCHTDVSFIPAMRFDLGLIPWVILCGVVCGFYSVYYSSVLTRCRRLFNSIGNVWMRALVGGGILALLLALFPSLYGEGYNILRLLMVDNPHAIVEYSPLYKLGLNFDVLMVLMLVLLLVKPLATSATNDSGGVGGGFTPTFFCGGVAGFLFAVVLNHFCGMHLPLALFAYFGMSAVMSGAIKAPLMAIFIASEITGLYGFILPLTISALASYVTAMALRKMWQSAPKTSTPVG